MENLLEWKSTGDCETLKISFEENCFHSFSIQKFHFKRKGGEAALHLTIAKQFF